MKSQDICIAGCLVGVLTLIVSFAILCCGFMKKYAKHMAGLNLLVASVMFLLPYIASALDGDQVSHSLYIHVCSNPENPTGSRGLCDAA